MANKDINKSCVLTQICIAYNLILPCRCYVKFDVNVFSNIITNVAILHYKTDIVYTCCNNCHVQVYPFIPRHFKVFMKNPKKTVSVSFEFGVDMSWQNSM